MFSLKPKPPLFIFHRGQRQPDHIKQKQYYRSLTQHSSAKACQYWGRCTHLGAAGKQALSPWGVPSAFLVWTFLKQQGGTAESVDSTFFGNSQTWQLEEPHGLDKISWDLNKPGVSFQRGQGRRGPRIYACKNRRVSGKKRGPVNSEVLSVTFKHLYPHTNGPVKLPHWTLSSSKRSADQQECPSRIRRTALLLWVRKMGGNHSQTTLVFIRRGDIRLDSLSRFHLNTQWKGSVTSHDEVILSFTRISLKAPSIQLCHIQLRPAIEQNQRWWKAKRQK